MVMLEAPVMDSEREPLPWQRRPVYGRERLVVQRGLPEPAVLGDGRARVARLVMATDQTAHGRGGPVREQPVVHVPAGQPALPAHRAEAAGHGLQAHGVADTRDGLHDRLRGQLAITLLAPAGDAAQRRQRVRRYGRMLLSSAARLAAEWMKSWRSGRPASGEERGHPRP
jgi:hypothetical protein